MEQSWKTIAIQAAIHAGEAIMEVYKRDFQVNYKGDNSPLTEADLKAHDIISEALAKTNIPILSEEGSAVGYRERKSWKKFWMVDPLDGTKEFVNRNDEFAVNITLIVHNKPVFGVIYAPVTKTIYAGGSIEKASYKMSNPPISLTWLSFLKDASTLSRKLKPYTELKSVRVVTSRSYLNEDTHAFINALEEEGKNTVLVPSGSSLKFCRIAEGEADVYPRFGPCMEWDTAAGDAICEGVGISIFMAHTTKRLLYNKESLFSPNFVSH